MLDVVSWTLPYAIVDPHRWWPGRRVVVSTDWIMGVDWPERVVRVDVPGSTVRGAPHYRPGMPFDRALDATLSRQHGHGRPGESEAHA
jgi:hypothetical protein